MTGVLRIALNDLLWTSLPLRDALKGDHRAFFVSAWARASAALCKGRFTIDETPLQSARDEALRLHALCLETCAALGIKGHDLVPHYNDRADAGFFASGDAVEALAALGMLAGRTAQALIAAEKEKDEAHAAAAD